MEISEEQLVDLLWYMVQNNCRLWAHNDVLSEEFLGEFYYAKAFCKLIGVPMIKNFPEPSEGSIEGMVADMILDWQFHVEPTRDNCADLIKDLLKLKSENWELSKEMFIKYCYGQPYIIED